MGSNQRNSSSCGGNPKEVKRKGTCSRDYRRDASILLANKAVSLGGIDRGTSVKIFLNVVCRNMHMELLLEPTIRMDPQHQLLRSARNVAK